MTDPNEGPDPVEDELHPIAEKAATFFERAGGKLTGEHVKELAADLDALAEDPMLGPAVTSLVKIAAYLEHERNARKEADKLLKIAVGATAALELQNKKAKDAKQDEAQRKRKQFAGFTGDQAKTVAPTFGAKVSGKAKPAHAMQIPTKFK